MARYDETWKKLRRAAHLILTPQKCLDHLPIQQAEATQLMSDLVHEPTVRPGLGINSFLADGHLQKFYNHIRRYSSSVIFSVLFGKRAPRYETKEVTDFFHVQHLWERLLEFGLSSPSYIARRDNLSN